MPDDYYWKCVKKDVCVKRDMGGLIKQPPHSYQKRTAKNAFLPHQNSLRS
jgi:hypothetical protein